MVHRLHTDKTPKQIRGRGVGKEGKGPGVVVQLLVPSTQKAEAARSGFKASLIYIRRSPLSLKQKKVAGCGKGMLGCQASTVTAWPQTKCKCNFRPSGVRPQLKVLWATFRYKLSQNVVKVGK